MLTPVPLCVPLFTVVLVHGWYIFAAAVFAAVELAEGRRQLHQRVLGSEFMFVRETRSDPPRQLDPNGSSSGGGTSKSGEHG